MYYEENKTQADIAKYFAISRPMVSKLLAEARELGIVTIRITEATSFHQIMEEQLREKYGLRCARVVPMESDEDRTDKSVVAAAWKLVEEKMNGSGCLGIGWGSLIGRVADHLEGREQQSESGGERGLSGVICPLIGNAAASYRSYHPNELVRILSGRTGLSPVYIYGPAIAESEAEKKIYENTDSYCQIRQLWRRLDVALINISNYPSSPDMATALRFGSRLSERKAAGHMLSYFYDREGRFIPEDSDRILRISREDLASAGSVTALCAGGVKAVAAAASVTYTHPSLDKDQGPSSLPDSWHARPEQARGGDRGKRDGALRRRRQSRGCGRGAGYRPDHRSDIERDAGRRAAEGGIPAALTGRHRGK
ncbi:sugar-binding transcriptional regulator [Bacilliculturomica massiliensis]|uniref:sugar-binding transcriptional regulator n=1 Tax=Bacilliculturomica massiliensis TaxID=1917867 RepID=UPI0013EEEAF6|nr:sugar-binding domain-containing protein [Bacilliculturomica massiliensis]